ncbi:TetR/AcrR family transcriptional regulator [Nocardia sp. NPDC050408]|uniref:TetR/AcrR family transcriptional regulator n=1 Tax=Nocardia sp. NPDC050408 TaxID=3364319 RepID=UPI00378D7AD8
MREAPAPEKLARLRTSEELVRRRLIQAATQLFLAEGFAATSIEQITERAGCTREVFFSHFSRKAVLGHTIADTLYRRALQRIHHFQPTSVDQLITTLAAWTSILVTRPGWAQLERNLADLDTNSHAITTRRLTQLRDAVTELLTTTTRPATSGADVETTVTFLASVVIGIATQHAHGLTIPSAIRPHIELVLRTAVHP